MDLISKLFKDEAISGFKLLSASVKAALALTAVLDFNVVQLLKDTLGLNLDDAILCHSQARISSIFLAETLPQSRYVILSTSSRIGL